MSQNVIECPACSRRTPAARAQCLYCNSALPITELESAPSQRSIDNSELAFNTILEPSSPVSSEQAEAALASALGTELVEAQALIRAAKPLPLARSLNRQEAEMIAALIRGCGLAASVVPDEDLKLDSELIRARRLAVGDCEVEVYHSGGTLTVPSSEIRLFVVGELNNTRIDYTEGITGKRGRAGSVLDLAEFRSEEVLLDVYSTGFDKSFRIRSDAFDYSGVVQQMSFQSDLNFKSMMSALRAIAPDAEVDDGFARVQSLLSRAWPKRSRVEARGIKRSGLAYRPVAMSSVTSDNRDQFDRYSRLMFVSL